MRYFLDQDSSCHWYLVEADKRKEWDAWRDLPEDDEKGWTAPDYAKELGCCPSLVEFENPISL